MKACFKWLKAFLALEVRNLSSSVTSLLPFEFQLLDLVNFFHNVTNLPTSALLISLPTISLSSSLKADVTDDLVVFNIEVSDVTILLKLWINH